MYSFGVGGGVAGVRVRVQAHRVHYVECVFFGLWCFGSTSIYLVGITLKLQVNRAPGKP